MGTSFPAERKNRVRDLGLLVALSLLLAVSATFGTALGEEPTDLTLEIDQEWVLLYPSPLTLTGTVLVNGDEVSDFEASWGMRSGPGLVSFSLEDLPTTVDFSTPGHYELQVVVHVGEATVDQIVRVHVVAADADYYVATDGNDSNDGRSVTTPFLTIRMAASVVRPGDVVMIRGGVYREYNNNAPNWPRSGEEGSPITFMAYPGEVPVIDGSGSRRDPSRRDPTSPELIRLRDIDWYVFDGLVLRNSNGSAFHIKGNHHVIRNVVTHSNHGVGIYLEGDFNLVEDSSSYDNNSWANGGESGDGVKITSGHGNVIRRVNAYNNSDDGFDLWATSGTVIEHCAAYYNGRGEEGDGNGFKLSSAGVDSGNIVRFNVSYSNRAQNFTDNGGGALEIYNNTSYDAGGRGFVVRGRQGLSPSIVFNNISYLDHEGVLIDALDSGGDLPESQKNSWDLGIDNPLFKSTNPNSEGFLRLRSSSPAVGAGIALDAVQSADHSMDLGAYQRGSRN